MKIRFLSNVRSVSLLALVALSACGGGGGDGGGGGGGSTTASTSAFPLAAGYRAILTMGENANFAVSGSCQGTAAVVADPARPASFEGTSGVSVNTSSAFNVGGCPLVASGMSVGYFDANYVPLGVTTTNSYAVYESPRPAIPASVTVGDSGPLGTTINYTNANKTTSTGRTVATYQVIADTATTARLLVTSRETSSSGQVTYTGTTTYRIAADGTLTTLSIDSTSGSTRILLTRI